MKKYLLSIAALLLGLLAHSQEADDLGNHAEVSVIARLDLNPVFNKDKTEFTLGNSSIYTLFTGSASEHFSWTLQNHWFNGASFLGPDANPWELFKGLGWSNTTNFIDMAYIDLMFGGWTFTLGKQCISTDGHEYDDNDWDVYSEVASPIWNDLACYQWGGKVAWTTPSDLTTLSLQMTTSPFGERPFGSGLWAWSAQWSGNYNWFAPLWSVSLLQGPGSEVGSAPKEHFWLFSLGNQFLLGDWTLTLDWSSTGGFNDEYTGLSKGHTFHGRIDYAPSERWDFSVRGNYIIAQVTDFLSNTMPQPYRTVSWWNAAAIAEFFPLRDSDALRLHTYVAYDNFQEAFSLNVGVRYNLTFKLW